MGGRAALRIRQAVRAWLRAHPEVCGEGIAVALSGGPDSLALLAGARLEHPDVAALIVDHGLQEGSADVAAAAAEAARGLSCSAVSVLRVGVERTGDGPEAAARDARYRALDAGRRGRPVLLGHTLDDQAETVLLGLGRGAGPRSIAGMSAWNPPWGRPLLGVRRADTEAACTEWGLAPWRDPHNEDPSFTRVRLRREVLPLLEEVLAGGVAEALARTADLVRVDMAELDTRALPLTPDGPGLPITDVSGLPRALRTRVLRNWMLANGVRSPTGAHIEAVDALLTGAPGRGPVAVPAASPPTGGARRLVVVRGNGTLYLETR